jgi:hypothetical protein
MSQFHDQLERKVGPPPRSPPELPSSAFQWSDQAAGEVVTLKATGLDEKYWHGLVQLPVGCTNAVAGVIEVIRGPSPPEGFTISARCCSVWLRWPCEYQSILTSTRRKSSGFESEVVVQLELVALLEHAFCAGLEDAATPSRGSSNEHVVTCTV